MSAEGRANVVVTIEWILFAVGVLILALLLDLLSEDIVDAFNSPDERTIVILVAVFTSVGIVIPFFMNLLITKGVKKNHPNSCKTWCTINIIFIFIYILNLLAIVVGTFGAYLPLLMVVVGGGGFLWYRIWALRTIMTNSNTDFSTELFEMKKKFRKLH